MNRQVTFHFKTINILFDFILEVSCHDVIVNILFHVTTGLYELRLYDAMLALHLQCQKISNLCHVNKLFL